MTNRKILATAASALVAAIILTGCPSTPLDKPTVEDRTPGSGGTVTDRPRTITDPTPPTGLDQRQLGGSTGSVDSELKDPKSILSKRSIYYDYDSDTIREEFRPLIQAHGKYLSTHRQAKMLIQGNTDDRGSREYNIALGQRRAEAVKRMLVLQGAQEAQIESVSLGKEKPSCEQSTEDCWSKNRRSDLLYGGEY